MDDIFGEEPKTQEKTNGLEDIIFDNNNYNNQTKPSVDPGYTGGFQPAANDPSKNPFDAFNAFNQPAQQQPVHPPTTFANNGMNQPSAFPQSNQSNSGLGTGQTDWNAGFSSQFSSDPFPATGGGFSNQNTANTQNKDFSALNPFPDQNAAKKQTALPPGVNGLDLFD